MAAKLEVARGAGSRYLVQRWGDGTVCDKTGKRREIEVQVCLSLSTYLARVLSSHHWHPRFSDRFADRRFFFAFLVSCFTVLVLVPVNTTQSISIPMTEFMMCLMHRTLPVVVLALTSRRPTALYLPQSACLPNHWIFMDWPGLPCTVSSRTTRHN